MESRKTINFIAYLAVALIALSFTARYVLTKFFLIDAAAIQIINAVIFHLALFITTISALAHAASKRNNAYMIVLISFIFAIILFGILL